MEKKVSKLWIAKAAAAFLAALIVVEFMDRSFLAVSIIEAVMYFLTLFTGYKYGVATGAVMGAACGLVQTVRMESLAPLGIFCVIGALAGIFNGLGKAGSSIGFAAAAVGIGAVYAPEFLSGQAPEMVTGILLFFILPKGLTRVEQVKKTAAQKEDFMCSYEEWSAWKLKEISESFTGLARSFAFCCQGESENADVDWKGRFMESREAVVAQFHELGNILEEAAGQITDVTDVTGQMENMMKHALKEHRIRPEKMLVLEHGDSRQEAYITMRSENGRCVTSKDLAETLSSETHRRWRPAADSRAVIGRESRTVKFEEDTEFLMLHGIARAVKNEENLSGDTFAFTNLPMGRVLLCLSDGMGSGQSAFAESETVIDLAEQLLEAGFSAEAAVKLINSVLLLRGEEQKPTTLDLCMVDLYSGACELVKLGAAATFIKRGRSVEILQTEALPIGMFREVTPIALENNLTDGDMIIMMTDGILEAFAEVDKEGVLRELIAEYDGMNTKELANHILKKAIEQTKIPRDDMTVLVAGIWKR